MKKTSKKDKLNTLLSAIIVIVFVICGYFFSSMATSLAYPWNSVVSIAIYVVFGLFLFYATRVGEGKQIFRFSPASLILIVIPTLYIILASLISALPLYEQLSANATIVVLASFALGYGIPYTFMSGFELKTDESEEAEEITEEAVKEIAEETTDEAVEEQAVEETVEDAAETDEEKVTTEE